MKSLESYLFLYSLFLSEVFFLGSQKVVAQVIDKGQYRSTPFFLPPKIPKPVQIPQPTPKVPLQKQLVGPRVKTPESAQTIIIMHFHFSGNTAFSNQQLEKITSGFLNRPITFTQLLQVEAIVTKFYTDAGYINSGAVIPAGQSFSQSAATVHIRIIEGELEAIEVKVDGKLSPEYIRSRLALASGKPLNQNRLLEALQVLQLDPLIQNISAELSSGSRPGSSFLSVKVKESKSFNIELFADNGRVESIGNVERGVRIYENDLFGIGDNLSLAFTNTDGSNDIVFNYIIPVNPHNGTIRFSAQLEYTNIIKPPFDQLNITGNSQYFDISFRQPILQSASQDLAFGVTFSLEGSQTTILGYGFPLSPGANDQGNTNLSVLRFFQEWTQRSKQDVLSMRSEFNLGMGIFGATVNPNPPDSRFFDWRWQGQYVNLLAPDTLLVLRSSLQVANKPLTSLEQFTLGGLYSVEGYRQNLLQSDNGFFALAEVRLPILHVDNINGLLQLIPFIDYGMAWNNGLIPNPNPNTLFSIGAGLQWQMGNNFTARLDYGIPLTQFVLGGKTLKQQELFFSLNYSIF